MTLFWFLIFKKQILFPLIRHSSPKDDEVFTHNSTLSDISYIFFDSPLI